MKSMRSLAALILLLLVVAAGCSSGPSADDRFVELVHDPRCHGVEAVGLTADSDSGDDEHTERRHHGEHDLPDGILPRHENW